LGRPFFCTTMTHERFDPPRWQRNPHLQSWLASSGPRTALVRRRAHALLAASREEILDCGDGIRLHGEYSPNPKPTRGLAILLHGWHGHSGSAYLLAAAAHLFERGFSVYRLHLRDHGPSHHLNRELFNSTRLPEVVNAVAAIARAHANDGPLFLGGFSLGGNFALRIAVAAPAQGIALTRVVAVCPVLDPARTMRALGASPLYDRYFQRKWRRALLAKLRHFPEYAFAAELRALRSLAAMNEFFVPRYTGFADTRSYLAAYAITGDRLARLTVPSHLITSRDDPVIPAEDLARLARPPALSIELTEFGGHCGFLLNWRLEGWIEQRLDRLFRPDGELACAS
jgi:predicted alpha/beta-fold hydrolase